MMGRLIIEKAQSVQKEIHSEGLLNGSTLT